MSRLIVKNLPKNIKEERMHELFGEMGQITDLKLKYTKHGVFRRFAFVGYKTQTEAQRALKHFNKTFINTSKIDVDICKDFGDDTAPRPWSKYSEKSSAFQKRAERREHRKRVLVGDDKTEKMEDNAERKSKKTKNALLDELESDSGFQEFLEAHKSRSTKHTWSNDEQLSLSQVKREEPSAKGKVSFKDSFETSSDDGNDDTDNKTELDEEADMDVDEYKTGSTEASNVALSDMDYLKKKITSKNDSTLSEQEKLVKTKKGNKKETILESERNDPSKEKKKSGKSETNNNEIPSMQDFERKSEFTIKLRGLPFHAKKKDITEFLSPLKVIEIRMPKDSKNRPSGRAYVDLPSKKDLKEALSRHKDYMKGRYIEVFEDKRKAEVEKTECESELPWIKNATELAENRDLAISETGRLYLRNLSYTCTEEDLSELFSKYGPTTEVFMPIDKHTSQPMGFAFITFMMPEHAVQAFNELDGHVFQGRLLHILPAKPKKNSDAGEVIDQEHQSSFKKKQKANVLSLKNKDHNWNTLFLGVNAVAEIMADKYSSSKGDILDVQSKGDLALRVALGETQIVAETREFLTKHGVKLDAFGSAEAKRSKTVIIVKNLQHGTAPGELQQLFSPFGHLGKIILPPSGVTALVEFLKLSSAAKAFEKIAYTKFKNVPLYLEWAPADVFNSEQPSKESEEQSGNEKEIKDNKNESGSDSDEEPESDGHVVFVKNLNFDSNEDSLKQLFSDVGKVKNVTIAKKKNSRNKGSLLSMGYGFVQFRTKKDALNAVKELQNYELDEHKLQLKLSNKKQLQKSVRRKSSSDTKQKSSKILVRNVPFEATKKELKELFGTFGELKTVRLPKKLSGTGPHRGFAFIDFLTKQDAKRAFRSLCTSTHLYGRRLVLEWAEDNESIEELRKKTADYFHDPKKQKTKTKNFEDEIQEQ